MKFSFRQILASTAGAVIAAVVASSFGVKGTIIGVAIGSAAATMATALVAQSIDRGHEAVKQVAVRVPETSTLLRKLGGTGVSGPSASSVDASSTPTEVVARAGPGPRQSGPSGSGDDGEAETVELASTAAPVTGTQRLEISAAADAPASERLVAWTSPARTATARGYSWRTIAVGAVIVFVLALLFITAVELISGKPLSTIFGGAGTGTTLNNLVNPSPTPATTPTSTTSTTTTSTTASSTTTTTTTTTTSSSSAGGTATSTTQSGGGVTATTSPGASTTTTTAGGGSGVTTTTTSAPSSPSSP